MTYQDIIQLVLSIGFPAACLTVLAKWTASRMDRYETAALAREGNLVGEIKDLRSNIATLEKWVRTELVGIIKSNEALLNSNRATMEQVITCLAGVNQDGEGKGPIQRL